MSVGKCPQCGNILDHVELGKDSCPLHNTEVLLVRGTRPHNKNRQTMTGIATAFITGEHGHMVAIGRRTRQVREMNAAMEK